MAIKAAKKTLRKEIANVIKNVSLEERIRQSAKVHEKVRGA